MAKVDNRKLLLEGIKASGFDNLMPEDPKSFTEDENGKFHNGGYQYHVWTEEEARAQGYMAGGFTIPSDSTRKVYRIA